MTRARQLAVVLIVAAGCAASLAGRQAQACVAAEHRQFDFWIGSWTVSDPGGRVLGTNEIRPAADGCALLEQWRGASGVTGVSTNFFEPATGRWNQVWVGSDGLILRLEGEYRDGAMQLTGTTMRATSERAVRDRVIWRAAEDGSVEQTWLVSRGEGQAWSEILRGVYR